MTDFELLRDYAVQGTEDAFATLVNRYVRLVYSAAFRQCGHVQDAEEITQAVFIILARKAGGLRQDTVLPGWLLRTTRFVAMNARRRQLHRLHLDHDQMNENPVETDAAWQQMAPVLDEALERLSVRDRDAVVLRYFEQRSFKEIAQLTATTEDGAQKRVTRALEKLRAQFEKRGLLLSSASILTAIAANAIQAAPAQLATTVVTAVKSGTALTGSVAVLVKIGLVAFKAARLRAIGLGSGAAVLFLSLIWFAAAKVLSEDPLANLSFRCIAASADGTKLAAAESGVGLIYASANSGADWHATTAPQGFWSSLASSADGTTLLAVGSDSGGVTNLLGTGTARIYTSTNSGASWTHAGGTPTNVSWTCAASSADGQRLAVAAEFGGIYLSTNAGAAWNLTSAPNKRWKSIASSPGGNRLVALATAGGEYHAEMQANGLHYTGDEIGFSTIDGAFTTDDGSKATAQDVPVRGGIYISDDSGLTWTRTSAPRDLWWWSVVCSGDGSKLAAATVITAPRIVDSRINPDRTISSAVSQPQTGGGSIYVSTNAGANWALTSVPSSFWLSLAASADGRTLVAASKVTALPQGAAGMICISRDSGATWAIANVPRTNWNSVAVSADGKKIFAVGSPGGIQIIAR